MEIDVEPQPSYVQQKLCELQADQYLCQEIICVMTSLGNL